jgi:hypothetical protein
MRLVKTALVVLVIAALPVGLTAAYAGSAGDGATAAAGKKNKKKSCKKGFKKKKGKCVKKKQTAVPVLGAALSINPGGVDFGNLNQGGFETCNPPPDSDCPTQAFTVTNAGPGPSGPISANIVVVATDPGDAPAFQVFANTCGAALAPGASCTVTVRASTDDNFEYVSRLDVAATPGGTVSASLEAQ